MKLLRILAFFASISLLIVSAYCDDASTEKSAPTTADHGGRKGYSIAAICVLAVVVAVLSFFLFRFWQKKKREEQYARLLKLFEEDDELELELGLRD